MNVYRETYRHSPRDLQMPQPYTPTPDGFERRLRAWIHLPTDDLTTPDAREASAPPKETGARDYA
ncbi:MAG TPA: hypothetical protein VGC99_23080 [Candidatus Tectomicrobia bacterium]